MAKIIFAHPLPQSFYLAFSGGPDSSALLHLTLARRRNVTLVHSAYLETEWGVTEREYAEKVAKELGLKLIKHDITTLPNKTSLEAHWSRERKTLFESLDMPVLTGHQLDDAVEWYIMSTMKGRPEIIPVVSGNVIRPLLLTSKERILQYTEQHEVNYIIDPYTEGTATGMRVQMRNKLMPAFHEVFPGARTTVAKLIKSSRYCIADETF